MRLPLIDLELDTLNDLHPLSDIEVADIAPPVMEPQVLGRHGMLNENDTLMRRAPFDAELQQRAVDDCSGHRPNEAVNSHSQWLHSDTVEREATYNTPRRVKEGRDMLRPESITLNKRSRDTACTDC